MRTVYSKSHSFSSATTRVESVDCAGGGYLEKSSATYSNPPRKCEHITQRERERDSWKRRWEVQGRKWESATSFLCTTQRVCSTIHEHTHTQPQWQPEAGSRVCKEWLTHIKPGQIWLEKNVRPSRVETEEIGWDVLLSLSPSSPERTHRVGAIGENHWTERLSGDHYTTTKKTLGLCGKKGPLCTT